MIGVLIADYFLVRYRKLHLTDLYLGHPTSAYWYTAGFNWRAPVAWYEGSLLAFLIVDRLITRRVMGCWPLIPGFVREVRMTYDYTGWDNLYRMNFFMGFLFAFVTHLILNKVFPVPGKTGSSPFVGLKSAGVLSNDRSV
jgi:nucleobase:cation symporter-1, NCS1 family